MTPYLGGIKIEELPIRYASVATDIENESEIIIDKGDLIHAIRSSISIPVAFVPNSYAGRVLIDGGFVNPVPITVAQKLGAKKIIAVNVLPRIEYPQVFISSQSPSNKTYNIKQIFAETFDLITSRLIDYEITKMKDGIIIDIDTTGIGISHFEKAKEAIDRGYKDTKKYEEILTRYSSA